MLTEEEKNAGLTGRIIPINIEEQMKSAYIDYSMSVIVSRALPDVRDGMKPVHRRILYDMSAELNLYSDKPTRKSARIVGDVLGKFHPHGDSSVYDAMVRLAQEWSMRYPLVDGQGNFGSMDGDSAAAMRYTEARLQKVTQEAFLADLDKDVVDFVPNFDETEKEPSVLPVKIPNLLVNGSEGIAVGMATSIPPHNLGEVIDAVKAYMLNNEITTKELMRYLKGPDFPTGGIVINKDELEEIYETGTGKIKLRGKVEFQKGKAGKTNVVITEIPYTMIGANIAKFLSDVAALSETKKTQDIVDISNQSSKEGIRIVIELRKDADPENFVNMLYKKTRLEDTFGVNMLAIANGRPETMGLKQIIKANVDFQFEVATRKYTNLLAKEMERKEIQEGLIKACNVIDLVIEILRGSKDRAMAKACLVEGKVDGIKFKSKESRIMAAQLMFIKTRMLLNLEDEEAQSEMDALIKSLEERQRGEAYARVRLLSERLAPLGEFVDLQRVYSSEVLNRFNMYSSIAVNGTAADGYSSGDAIKAIQETAAQVLPKGYGYDFDGITREEAQTGSNTTIIFGICILLIYLILSALYESFLLPFAVILSVPCGLLGSFLFAKMLGLENNIYLQTGIIMLIGLLSKTAILITEYASDRRRAGMTLTQAAVSAAKVRLRPILMTVLTCVFGMIPLVLSHGVGANGNMTLGSGVVGGMIVGTLALLFLVPTLFIVFQTLQEKIKPIEFDPDPQWAVQAELEECKNEKEEE